MTEETGMDPSIAAGLRTFSPEHRRWVESVLNRILRYYGENLLGFAIL